MQTIKVNLKEHSYNILIGNNIIGLLGKFINKLGLGCDAYVITNASIKNRYGEILGRTLRGAGLSVKFRLIPDTEKSKSIEMAASVIKDLAAYDRKKRVFIVAFGGGVIGDLTGFIASVYKRGTPYIQVPTTLLAQVDSAIGGKTAVDLVEGKNLIGAFYQPGLVVSEIKFLRSLNPRQLRSGIAEVIKYGIIKDAQLFSYLEKEYKAISGRQAPALEYIVRRSSEIKAGIVSQDEKEKNGIRTILNFGHTVAHAIETAGGYKGYNHGEAVALGMLVAGDISKALGLIDNKTFLRIEGIIKRYGLPEKIKGVTLRKIIDAHYRDKKFIGEKNRFVLTKGIAKTKIRENIPFAVIKEALKKRLEIT